MIFVTVGSSYPFNRLIKVIDKAVSQGLIDDTVFAQTGVEGERPENFEWVEILNKEEYDQYFKKADIIIGHAGMGTISMALEFSKPILVMPRLRKYRELVNGHQYVTAKHFEKLGHILCFEDENELGEKLKMLKNFKPVPRNCNIEGVALKIAEFIKETEEHIV